MEQVNFVHAPNSPGFRSRNHMRLSYLQDALLICVTAMFLYGHASHALKAGSLANVFFVIDQAILVGIFLTRRRTNTTSTRVSDWIVATIGSWLPLALRPHETGGLIQNIGVSVQIIGLTIVIVSLLSLGRSFGVVAANRGLKTGGMYAFVRHPIYLGHAVTVVGFLMTNLWWPNLAIYAVAFTGQMMRIRAEERVLSETSDYQTYKARVRWRLLPGVY